MPDFCRVESNQYHQVQCFGCCEIGPLFLQLRRSRDIQAGPVQIHKDFRELSRCAERCIACQVFQRAFLLEQITVEESHELYLNVGRVFVMLKRTPTGLFLHLQIKSIGAALPHRTATVICSLEDQSTHIQGVPEGADWSQLRSWISGCDEKHACRKYRWSNKNPSWMVKVLPGDLIQLVRGSDLDGLAPYVALSYCWGNEKSITAKDPNGWETVKRAKTRVLAKGKPVIERITPFSRLEYPKALQDAIHITQRLGLEYIWIDAVCIPELDDWDVEAGKMHEVYGNASLTLFACAADTAIDPLCTRRRAWEHPVKGCRLFDYWLTNRDPTLPEVRMNNPLAHRGWILQEERLSPRILFWCAQRAYWSCCERHATESRQAIHTVPSSAQQSRPQEFMMLSRNGDTTKMQEQWLDLVASYTRRNLSEQGKEKDRFRAIAGLAVRYLSSSNGAVLQQNEYLAGLWRHSFARQLVWRVLHSVPPEDNLRSVAPSWSWASLPLRTEVDLQHEFEPTVHFQLLEKSIVTAADTAADVVAKGATVKTVQVRGRLRKLIGADSVIVPWEAVVTSVTHPDSAAGEELTEIFNMSLAPDQSVHARSSDSRIVVYEAHKDEIFCQLDYLNAEFELETANIFVAVNDETNLYCFEVGESSMLLLEEVEIGCQRFRRAGLGVNYRRNFFDGYGEKEIVLE